MAAYSGGSVKITAGSSKVYGSNTEFVTYLEVGDLFKITSENTFYNVAAINTATELTLTSRYTKTNLQSAVSTNLASVNTATTGYSGNVGSFTPVIQNNFWLVASPNGGGEKFTDDGAGILTGENTPAGSGTIDYDSGGWTVVFGTPLTATVNLVGSFLRGTSQEGLAYQVVSDFTPNYKIPEMSTNDVNFSHIYTQAMRTIDQKIKAATDVTGVKSITASYLEVYSVATLNNANIVNASITNASIQKLKATNASFNNASVNTLKVTKLSGINASFNNASVNTLKVTKLSAVNASLTNASIQKLKAINASFNNASVNTLKVMKLGGINASFTNASIQNLTLLNPVTNWKAVNASFTNASIQKLQVLSASILEASIGTLRTGVFSPANLSVTNLDAVNASFTNASIQKLKATNASFNNASISILKTGSNLVAEKYVNLNATRGTNGYGIRDNSGITEHKHSGIVWVRTDGYVDGPDNANSHWEAPALTLDSVWRTINVGTICSTKAHGVRLAILQNNAIIGKTLQFRKHGNSNTRNVLAHKQIVAGVTEMWGGDVEISATGAFDYFGTGTDGNWSTVQINIRGSYV